MGANKFRSQFDIAEESFALLSSEEAFRNLQIHTSNVLETIQEIEGGAIGVIHVSRRNIHSLTSTVLPSASC